MASKRTYSLSEATDLTGQSIIVDKTGNAEAEKSTIDNLFPKLLAFIGLTDGYIPYKISDAVGLDDSPISTNGTSITLSGSFGISGNINQTGTNSTFDVNPYVKIRVGRSSNNAGFGFEIYKGDNSTTVNHWFAGNGKSYVCLNNGNFIIGTSTDDGLNKLQVNGAAKITGTLTVIGQAVGGYTTKTFSATPTFNFNQGNSQQLTLTGNLTSWTISNDLPAGSYVIYLIQDSTGSRTIPDPTGIDYEGNNSIASFDTTANAINIVNVFIMPDGTSIWSLVETINP